jgi:hypothetical protein
MCPIHPKNLTAELRKLPLHVENIYCVWSKSG